MNLKPVVVILLAAIVSSCVPKSFTPEEINLIPKPGKITINKQSFRITSATSFVISDKEQTNAADYLNGMLKNAAGFVLDISDEVKSNTIVFVSDKNLMKEAYKLLVTPKQITISASSGAGWFYGVQTIRQLLPPEIEKTEKQNIKWLVPCVEIEDAPRFSWRGMHMDFSRHFFNIEEVKTFLDYMSLYKLNTYHMHLTDDQGWRIEIKKYPLLTEKGAWRTENNQDEVCKERAKEDETFTINPSNYRERDGQIMYGGFFTQEQIKEIVQYADERYITVVPEIDMPGHFKSAIDNYPYLACRGEAGWGATFSIPACLGQKESYDFVKDILSEVAELFPGEYIHIGGDEVNTSEYEKCKKCQAVIKKNKLKNVHELQSHFNRKIEAFLHTKGKRLMGWDEIVEGGLTEDASMMWWRNWAPKLRHKAANNGNDMVITPDFEYYFDFMNEATPLKKVYNYEPVPEDFTQEQEKHIIGVQANVWSEWIPNFKRLQVQVFPRILGLAETGWNKKNDKDFDAFLTRVKNHYSRLDAMNINYYLAPISGMNKTYAFIDSALVDLNIDIEGAEIYYTTDGSKPTLESNKYNGPFYVKERGTLLARAYKGTIAGDVYTAQIDKQTYLEPLDVSPTNPGFKRWVKRDKFASVEKIKLDESKKPSIVTELNMGEYDGESQIAFKFTGYFKAEKKVFTSFQPTRMMEVYFTLAINW